MKKYRVLLTHDITESKEVEVEAEDPEEAMEKAMETAFDVPGGWDTNDCGNCQGAYCGGGLDDVEEIQEGVTP